MAGDQVELIMALYKICVAFDQEPASIDNEIAQPLAQLVAWELRLLNCQVLYKIGQHKKLANL